MIREAHTLNAKRQDCLVHNGMPSGSVMVLPPSSKFNGGYTTSVLRFGFWAYSSHPLRPALPFLFDSSHNIETRSKEQKWASLCLIITSILSMVGAVVNRQLRRKFILDHELLTSGSRWIRTPRTYHTGIDSWKPCPIILQRGHKPASNVGGIPDREALSFR
ncbi:hypothetical protein DFS33DRAFT_1449999 [Desarmillaria ectypa]|nr:hypothetical protein DFS33DRAFT_1449999 [Desarmillaria ectypa]